MLDGSLIVVLLMAVVLLGMIVWIIIENPDGLLYILILYLPFEEFVEKWLPPGPVLLASRLAAEMLLFSALVYLLGRRFLFCRGWRRSPIDLALGGFLVVAVVSMLRNDIPLGAGSLGVRVLVRYVAAFYLAVNIDVTEAIAIRMMRAVVTVAVIVSSIAIIQSVVGPAASAFLLPAEIEYGEQVVRAAVRGQLGAHSRVFATLGRYDTLGTFLTVVLVLSAGLFGRVRGSDRKLLRALWIVGVPALILTYSRQSWLTFYIGLLIVLSMGAKRSLFLAALVGPLAALIVMALAFPDAIAYSSDSGDVTLLGRVLEPFSSGYFDISRNNFGRLYVLIEVGGRIFGRALVMGFGPGAFGSLTSRVLGFESGALVDVPEESAFMINDVNWITLFGQLGMLGVIFFVLILFQLYRFAHAVSKRGGNDVAAGVAQGYTALVFVFAFLGFFGPNFEVRQVAFYFWAFGGILVSLANGVSSPTPSRSI